MMRARRHAATYADDDDDEVIVIQSGDEEQQQQQQQQQPEESSLSEDHDFFVKIMVRAPTTFTMTRDRHSGEINIGIVDTVLPGKNVRSMVPGLVQTATATVSNRTGVSTSDSRRTRIIQSDPVVAAVPANSRNRQGSSSSAHHSNVEPVVNKPDSPKKGTKKIGVDSANLLKSSAFAHMLDVYGPKYIKDSEEKARILGLFLDRFTLHTHIHNEWRDICTEDARRIVARALAKWREDHQTATAKAVDAKVASAARPAATVADTSVPYQRRTAGSKLLVHFGMGATQSKMPGNVAYLREVQLRRVEFHAASLPKRQGMVRAMAKQFNFEMPKASNDNEYDQAVNRKIYAALSKPIVSHSSPTAGAAPAKKSKPVSASCKNDTESDDDCDETDSDDDYEDLAGGDEDLAVGGDESVPGKSENAAQASRPATRTPESNRKEAAQPGTKLRVYSGNNPSHRNRPGNAACLQQVQAARTAFSAAGQSRRWAIIEGIAQHFVFDMPPNSQVPYDQYVYRRLYSALVQRPSKRKRKAAAAKKQMLEKRQRATGQDSDDVMDEDNKQLGADYGTDEDGDDGWSYP